VAPKLRDAATFQLGRSGLALPARTVQVVRTWLASAEQSSSGERDIGMFGEPSASSGVGPPLVSSGALPDLWNSFETPGTSAATIEIEPGSRGVREGKIICAEHWASF
jgi:hypothetical protein